MLAIFGSTGGSTCATVFPSPAAYSRNVTTVTNDVDELGVREKACDELGSTAVHWALLDDDRRSWVELRDRVEHAVDEVMQQFVELGLVDDGR